MQSEKLKVIGTGLSGLVGSRVVELLRNRYEFEDLSLETRVDITQKQIVEQKISKTEAKVILHMAAVTDVDGCEEVQNNNGICWRVNVEGTRNIVQVAKKYDKKLIYISTDFVFGGEKDIYTEKDKPKPVNYYGQTKYEGEEIVQKLNGNWIIARLAFPYRTKFSRPDVVRFFLDKLQRGEEIKAVEDWVITPTFIDDIASALDTLIQSNTTGIYHVVGSSSHTPYEMAIMICNTFNLDKAQVKRVKLNDLFAGKARRPRRLVMENDKITELGVRMKTLKEGLKEIRKQI